MPREKNEMMNLNQYLHSVVFILLSYPGYFTGSLYVKKKPGKTLGDFSWQCCTIGYHTRYTRLWIYHTVFKDVILRFYWKSWNKQFVHCQQSVSMFHSSTCHFRWLQVVCLSKYTNLPRRAASSLWEGDWIRFGYSFGGNPPPRIPVTHEGL